MNRPDWTRRFTAVGVVSVVVMALLVALIVILVTSWNWVSGSESGSTTIRNVGLVAGGVLALWLAFWRSKIADRQADTAQKQSETAELGLLNERYQQGTEMLNSEELSVRLDGVHTLARLAKDEPERYHLQIMSRFCAFVCDPTKDDGGAAKPDEKNRLRKDVQAVMAAIGTRGETGLALEKKVGFALDLRGADLRGGYLPRGANLSGANLMEANLSGVRFARVNLSGAELHQTNLSSAVLSFAIGLTQEQLDEACADVDRLPRYLHPPRLGSEFLHLKDAETGEPLVWHGQPCDGN